MNNVHQLQQAITDKMEPASSQISGMFAQCAMVHQSHSS